MSNDSAAVIPDLDEIALQEQLSVSEKLVLETATCPWRALERLFAAGKVIAVDADLDLIDVATKLHDDDTEPFETWIAEKRVAPVTDDQALNWHAADATLWTVVVRPWVLVQDRNPR